MKIDRLFPTIVITDYICEYDLNAIKKEVESIFPEIDKLLQGDSWADNVYTTFKSCKCLITKYNLQNTFNSINPIIRELASQINISQPDSLKLIDSWINITTHLGYQELHIHGHKLLSGVLYLDVPPDSGVIQFSPPINESILKPSKSYLPKEGLVTAFHGSVPHRVTYNRTNKKRISLAFNYEYKL